MCAIIDTNAVHQILTDSPSDAGKGLLNWIEKGYRRLVVGGRLMDELKTSGREVEQLIHELIQSGNVRSLPSDKVTEREREIQRDPGVRSDDPHVIALAQLSGARLLFSNDRVLSRDFMDTRLIHNPYGHVYTTRGDDSKSFTQEHADLLGRENLCGGVCI